VAVSVQSIVGALHKREWAAAMRRGIGCCGVLLFATAQAQVQLPGVQLPQVPIQLPVNPGNTLDVARDTLDPRRLQDLRLLRIRELLRTNRRELEADPNGAPAIRGEIVMYAPTEASLRIALAAGFTVVREATLPGLDIKVLVLNGRARATTRAELRRLRRADPTGSYDFNHLYIESGQIERGAGQNEAVGRALPDNISMQPSVRVGLIDTGVDKTHPSLSSAVVSWGCQGNPVAGVHGTAVASLLIGHAPKFLGASPGASLFAADVYCGKPTGGAVESIAGALAWLAQEKVPVINVSLVGPTNVLLEKIIATMVARGHIVVAAVGNDGPAARPLYPAAYPGVVGVTGVDTRRRVLVEALRGPQVDFAAPGVDMAAAGLSGYVAVRGTSFAAPIVAGLLARGWAQSLSPLDATLDPSKAQQLIDEFNAQAVDLGARGIDKIYGRGLIGEAVRIAPSALMVAERK